ncbi:uncharacterized protein DUF288 [Gillisia mitskevichiae]|uniref:Uncharacterized protein DUF288 n=1 Tax=Gillisia mitskevichiae TaxID=270921 RepID=A0A495P3C4_9FLAO|nr:STELLO glycosyltransferase family protein [Gillisia mitskevichiae]RKS45124.1 uncharacterized protein DUF288 [Gillisia mitskevichiae]
MKKSIIITSIFDPTEAIKAFAQLKDYNLIVIGDKKSPENWSCENVTYLSVNDQNKLNFQILKFLPYDHYSRKMIGYLLAIKNNADFIIDTDDDNIPKENWSFPQFNYEYDCIKKNIGFVNVYQLFTKQKIWPRGLPLNLINKEYNFNDMISLKNCNVGIWQGLADEDPDVDAIYRLTSDTPCYFEERKPIVLSAGTICPFNTQNTMIIKQLFPLLYLPTFVTFRFTDILRGLVAQPIMWLYNYQLGFINATVVQKRNPHDYMKDFISELPMYEHCDKIMEIVSSAISPANDIADNLRLAYQALFEKSVVSKEELITLDAWLDDIKHFQ